MGINSTEVAYGFGQMGSLFNDGTAACAPPTGKVFVAITMLEDTTFDTSAGLVADNDSGNGLEYIGSVFAREGIAANDDAHDEASSTATLGSGGVEVDVNNTFPKGITIYGRWTSVNPASGSFIAYIGN